MYYVEVLPAAAQDAQGMIDVAALSLVCLLAAALPLVCLLAAAPPLW